MTGRDRAGGSGDAATTHQAAGRGRDEIADLVLVGHVVQEQQGALAVQPVAEHRCACVYFGGDLRRGHPELAQKRAQDGDGRGRWLRRVEAAQVDVQLRVLEVAGVHEGVGDVDGELCFADTAHPFDVVDHHGSRWRGAGGRLDEPGRLGAVAGEGDQVGGQLSQHAGRFRY